jgi:hypothetical protein
MDEADLRWYAERNAERAKDLPPAEFVEKIKNGERIVIEYKDGTISSYELIAEN